MTVGVELTPVALVAAVCAALLVGFSKTGMPGAGIPAVALMAEVFRANTKLSVGAILPLLLVGDFFAIAYYRRHADWKRLAQLCPYVIVGMVPGYWVLWKVDDATLRVAIGIIVLVLLALHVARERYGFQGFADRWWFVAATGALAGFGTTVSNAAGPVMGIYLVSQHMAKHRFLGTSAWFFFLVNASKIPWFTAMDMLTADILRFSLVLVPIVACGALIGARVLKHIPQRVFDVLVLTLAGVAAVWIILS